MKKYFCLIIFVMLVTVSLSASGDIKSDENFNNDDYLTNNVVARIFAIKGEISLPRNIEIAGGRPGEYIDIIIPRYRLIELDSMGINYSIQIEDFEDYMESFRGEYHTLAEVETLIENIAEDYPDITTLYSIGKTYEDRDIWCLEISDNPGEDEGEPGIFFMGLHHAREWPTIEICLNIADELTSKYDSDPDITEVVDNCRIWLVTCVNPDGYYYCHDQGIDWRKNRHYLAEFGTYGIDLNRNYGGSINGDAWGAWGSVGKSSVTHNSGEEVYCGPGSFSELETQAIKNVFIDNDICAAITWHTHGELVMWPWGYSKTEQAPDNSYLEDIGQEIASRITRQSGSGTYTPYQASTLYPTTGDTTDWAYGFGHYNIGKPIFAYTIEACTSFHPSEGYLNQVVDENFDGAMYLLQEAGNIRDTVIPRVIAPKIEEMSSDLDGNYLVSWEEQNPDASPDYFQLDELTELSIYTDDAELGADSWILDSFSISSSKCHSESHSFKSRYSNEDVSSMTSITPIPITNEMNLSFWCWYNIEEEWDYAFVEISKNGRCYDVIDEFTGSSGGWVFKEYSLDDYINESIFIRFRYTTDSYTMEEGFYVDDISPLAEFADITTISDSITDNCFEITDKSDGLYYYRVRGYNSKHEWGDFSTLESMNVNIGDNLPPENPSINGPSSGKTGVEQEYIVVTIDPENNNVYYFIDWGDGTDSAWVGPYESDEEVTVKHTWLEKGKYTLKVKAKDTYDSESDWTTLEVTMPLFKISINTILAGIIARHSLFFNIFKTILKL